MDLKEKIEGHSSEEEDTFYVLYDPARGFLNTTGQQKKSVLKFPGTGSKKRVTKEVVCPKFDDKIDLRYARNLSQLRDFVKNITWMKYYREHFELDLTKLVPVAFRVEKKITFEQKKTTFDLQKVVSATEMEYVVNKLKKS